MTDADNPRSTVAVIGSGIGGLTATWLLQRKYDVTLFEQHATPGMGVFTVDYHSNNQHTRIDVPLRIFTKGYYKHLLALFNEIGVTLQETNHSAVFTDDDNRIILHYGKIPWFGRGFALPKGRSLFSLRAWRLSFSMLSFSRLVHRDFHDLSSLRDQTFAQYIKANNINQDLLDTIVLPMMSVVCTCDYQAVLDYPADLMIGYLGCGVMKQGVIRAEKGVDDIVPRLIGTASIETNSTVTQVEKIGDRFQVTTAKGERHQFDQVVMATQAQHSAAILRGFDQFRQLLENIPFEQSAMRVHTDTSFLPSTASPLSPVVYHLPKNSPRPEVSVDLSKAFETYRNQEPVFQTWHPLQRTDSSKILIEAPFTRPVVTLTSRESVLELQSLQKTARQGLWFCGAYMADRVPLLDAAVQSAIDVARQLGVSPPWQAG